TGLKGRFVDTPEIEIRCRAMECGRTDTRHVRSEALELCEVAARPEHEHAAVPVVVPRLDELPRTPLVGLLHEARDAKRGTARRAALDIAVSGLRAPRDDAEGHELSGLGRAERSAGRLLESQPGTEHVVARSHQGYRIGRSPSPVRLGESLVR